jgi:glycosyltransferase involved in cell wall biosynthesis
MSNILNSLYARIWSATNRVNIPLFRSQLQQILRENESQPVVIFPPGLGWVIQLFQRPQQLALALGRQGALVFYVEPIHPSSSRGIHRKGENFYICHIPLESFQILERPYVHVMTWNARAAQSFNRPRIIYDYVDDLDAFEGNREKMESDHRQMVKDAWLVLATARRLFQEVQVTRPDSLLVPNGVDYDHFSPRDQDISRPVPGDLAPILAESKPIIGYHGALAHWFDFELFEIVAFNRQDLKFVLIGPDVDNSLRNSGLLKGRNIHWLGMKSYQELPEYVRKFDVAIIPFKLNEITHSTSPIKLYEYMAAGKPVVITPMQESASLGSALLAEGMGEFCHQLEKALTLKDDAAYTTRLRQIALQNTWNQRASQILKAFKRQSELHQAAKGIDLPVI